MIGNSKFQKSGFTLVEAVIVVFIFSLITLTATNLFTNTLYAHRQGIAMKEINEESQIILERMSKEIRMAKITSPINPTPYIVSSLSIKTNQDQNITYSFVSNIVKINNQQLNSNKIQITNGQFYIVNTNSTQPYITIKFQAKDIRWPKITKTFQTTISPRSGPAY